MASKVVFLGAAGDHVVFGKQIRGSGGFVVQADGIQMHFDPGPGTLVRNREFQINPRENVAIFVSHAHLNHCNDVNALIAATTANCLDHNCVLVAPKSVVAGYEGEHSILTEFHKNGLERIIQVEKGNRVGINKVEVVVLPTVHSDKDGVGYKLITSRFTLVYSGDTEYFPEMIDLYKGAEIIVLNVQEPFGKHEPGHLSADDAVKIFKELKPKLGVVTHFGAKMIMADPMMVAREIQTRVGNVQVMAAKDGLMIDPMTILIALKRDFSL